FHPRCRCRECAEAEWEHWASRDEPRDRDDSERKHAREREPRRGGVQGPGRQHIAGPPPRRGGEKESLSHYLRIGLGLEFSDRGRVCPTARVWYMQLPIQEMSFLELTRPTIKARRCIWWLAAASLFSQGGNAQRPQAP